MNGTVVDSAANRVQGASVSAIELEVEPGSNSRYRSETDPRYIVKTDAQGCFRAGTERPRA
jgi:hypothetical protein